MSRSCVSWVAAVAAAAAAAATAAPLRGEAPAGAAAREGEFTLAAGAVTLVLDEPAARQAIAAQLVLIGRDPDEASAAAGCLTAADLAVLLANPDMMQAAGAADSVWIMILIGVLVLGGLIVLAATADSGFLFIGG